MVPFFSNFNGTGRLAFGRVSFQSLATHDNGEIR